MSIGFFDRNKSAKVHTTNSKLNDKNRTRSAPMETLKPIKKQSKKIIVEDIEEDN